MCSISVIVPIYNVEKYLDRCISSILAQSFKDFELILIDDGSTDSSKKLCTLYENQDARIKVVHQENRGLSSARNVGIELAKGDYITFIDSDDFIHFTMLEVLYSNMIKNKADISICQPYLVYEGKEVLKEAGDNSIKLYSNIEAVRKIVEKSESNMIIACSKLYKRSLFDDIRYPLGKYHEDEFVTYKLFYKSNVIVESKAKLYYYLQRADSITGSAYSIKRLDKLQALEEAIIFFKYKKEKALISFAEFRYLLNIQIAYYRVKYEMNCNKETMYKLKVQYNQKFTEFKMENISYAKKMLLNFFYICPNFYCSLVRLYSLFANLNLSFVINLK